LSTDPAKQHITKTTVFSFTLSFLHAVYGPPRVYTEALAVEAAAGEDARLEVSLCGEPRPEVKWDLGLVVLSPGSRHGRFVTDILVGVPGSLHCYKTVLYIVGAVQG
jgi:hypothetical protein